MTQTTPDATTPVGRLDPEDAQLALATVQEVLHRHELVENLVHRQERNDARSDLVEGLLHRQHGGHGLDVQHFFARRAARLHHAARHHHADNLAHVADTDTG